jgi:hypothetical protein
MLGRVRCHHLALALAVACGGNDPAAQADGGGDDADLDGGADVECPDFDAPVALGAVDVYAAEISGLAVSRRNPGILWANEDDDGEPVLFGMEPTGEVQATLHLARAATDTEDLARGPGPIADAEYLYLADTGDNALTRDTRQLLRVLEPEVPAVPGVAALDATPDAIALTYDDGARHDAEAILVTPDGDLVLVTKRSAEDPVTRVYRGAGVAAAADGDTIELETLLTTEDRLRLGDHRVVSLDRSADGAWLLVGIKDDPYFLWPLGERALEDALAAAPCRAPIGGGQIETGAFDGDDYYAIPEGEAPEVLIARRR